jgi:hypothetical protein
LRRLYRQGAQADSPPKRQPRRKGAISKRQFLPRERDVPALRGRKESHRGGLGLPLIASAQSPDKEWSMTGDAPPWLTGLLGGLPADFDYGLIRSADDARSLILTLPAHDRGMAAPALHYYRGLVGHNAAYRGITTAWDHDERDTIDAFGSPDQFINALRDVAPPLRWGIASNMVPAWRGIISDKADCLHSMLGLSWTRSRDVACWFATRHYVPELQPSLLPFVFHVDLERRAIAATHGRYEQELLVDVQQLLDHVIAIDGCGSLEPTELHSGSEATRCLIGGWRCAVERYEHRKGACPQ